MRMHLKQIGLALAVSALALVSTSAQVTLHDLNSTAIIDPGSQNGMFHWDVQGLNQLNQQWFWYSVGNGPVASLDTLSAPSITPKGPNEAIITYNNGAYSVSIDYVLTGGTVAAPGQHASADIGESIRIINNTANPLPFHFYQYSYFNLYGASSDTVQLGQDLHGHYNEAAQNNGGVAMTETVITPGATHGEVAPVGGTLSKLNSGGPVTLGPPFFDGPLGPGAVTWAFQWDFVDPTGLYSAIAPGGSKLISKDKFLDVIVIPEPSSLALIAVGSVVFAARRRRS
jgi:hypothetical protein